MKKKVFIFLLNISLLLIILFQVSAETITGDTITGEASAQSTNVSIFVLPPASTITISYPANISYSSDVTQLNYSITNSTTLSGCWYSLDRGVTNSSLDATCSNFTGLSSSEGLNTWTVYLNDTSSSNFSSPISFTKDTTVPTYSNSGTDTTTVGEAVKFSILYDDNIALQSNGQYIFSTNNTGVWVNDSVVNFTATPEWANVTKTLNSTSGLLIGYRWYADDSAGNTNNTELFTLTTTAAAVPPPDDSGGSGGGSGGGGGGESSGGDTTTQEIIKTDKDSITITLKQGETKSEELVITNVGTTTRIINLSSLGIEDFFTISETIFNLEAGKNKTIILKFISRENTFPDLYQGKLIIKSGGIEKVVLIAIEVESKELLFDISVEIPGKFLEIVPGGELLTNIKLFNLGTNKSVVILLDYSIRDSGGNLIFFETRNVTVKTQTSFPEAFKIPLDAEIGDYLFYVKATYNNQLASASTWFKVRPKTFLEKILPPFVIVLIVAIIIIIIILLSMRLYYELQMIRKRVKI